MQHWPLAAKVKLITETCWNLLENVNFMLFSSLLRGSPCLPQHWIHSLAAGGRGAEDYLWGRGLLPSGCGDSLVRAGPGNVRQAGGRSAPQGAPEHFAVKPQTQLGDLLAVGFLLPHGLAQGLRETVYMQRLPSVPESAYQEELHPDCWRWEGSIRKLD